MDIINIIKGISDGTIKEGSKFHNKKWNLIIQNEKIYYIDNGEDYELEFYMIIEMVQDNEIFIKGRWTNGKRFNYKR